MFQDPDQAWQIEENGYSARRTEILGSKFLIANGSLGYRGTLEEHGKEALVACTLSGLYDRRGSAWREPVNAPNGLFLRLFEGRRPLSPASARPLRHSQGLDFRHGIHHRSTVYSLAKGNRLTYSVERFASLEDTRLLCLRAVLKADKACVLTLHAGVDADVWDINGPHFGPAKGALKAGLLSVDARTNEGVGLRVVEALAGLGSPGRLRRLGSAFVREFTLRLSAGQELSFTKFAAVGTSKDGGKAPLDAAKELCRRAVRGGYSAALASTKARWEQRWKRSDVRIEGDPEGQKALRYSIYQLLSIAPQAGDRASIPARGLSGQVYKGAIFWDTEMFMLPFFNATQPELARNLVRYRVHTLPGARRKAASLGHRGAFYAWESQESGDEACTLFNITDVITKRPLRTYFADKQVHISADVAHGVWQYYLASGDESILLHGGAEVLLECARFFLSWSYLNPLKGRYEILDVTGPDEYHERVHNNAYSSAMARRAVTTALQALDLLKRRHPRECAALSRRLKLAKDLPALKDLARRLYVPAPDPSTKVIEQFDGYRRLEDVDLKTLKTRLLDPREYLGGGQGLATTTKILKQADVVMMLNVLGSEYTDAVKKANWEYYEPRTEHGSSLSACVYALVAASIGRTEWAYRYFMKTATVDLSGDSKQYVGSLYIGGTHPAANGGAWMAAVLGFGGLSTDGRTIRLRPSLPKAWRSLSFSAAQNGQWVTVRIGRDGVRVEADRNNTRACPVQVGGASRALKAGEAWSPAKARHKAG
ncbi:MAG TPA: glycosyl hydrolase family 65 protein [bacterium]|jgi:nigerose phosphorylase|nr:glycosyl hydrolase family 65 protein [bacterium]